jgi:hypothetical protein
MLSPKRTPRSSTTTRARFLRPWSGQRLRLPPRLSLRGALPPLLPLLVLPLLAACQTPYALGSRDLPLRKEIIADPAPRPQAKPGESSRTAALRATQWGKANERIIRQGGENYDCLRDRLKVGVNADDCTRPVTP